MTDKGILICFIGTDGTGKTTLAKLVTSELCLKRKKVKMTYGRHRYILSGPAIFLGRKIFMKNKEVFGDYDRYLYDKRKVYRKNKVLIDFFTFLFMTDYLIQIFFKIVIPLKLGYIVVSDRYLYDTVINEIAVDRNMDLHNVKTIFQKYEKLIPSPDVAFLVEIPENIAMQRKDDIPSQTYIRIRNEFYRQFAMRDEIVKLDGTLSLTQLRLVIFKILKSRLGIA